MRQMERAADSHKGENGRVAIIGGSAAMHGAPLFSALAAEQTGVDLLYICLPACHADAAKQAGLNFQVQPFQGDELANSDTEAILELLATMDSAVIGPGIGRDSGQLQAMADIVAAASCQLVLDASALQPGVLDLVRGKGAVLTPHLGELERMQIDPEDLSDTATEYQATLLLKGQTDRIASPDSPVVEVSGGNAGLTVGGTGDVLAGIIAGLLAQGMQPAAACRRATTLMKHAADTLYPRKGYAFTATDIIGEIAPLLHAYDKQHG